MVGVNNAAGAERKYGDEYRYGEKRNQHAKQDIENTDVIKRN